VEATEVVLGEVLVQVNVMFDRVREIKIREIGRVREIKTVRTGSNIKTKIRLKDAIMLTTDKVNGMNMLKIIIIEADTAMATVVRHS
jgi:ribosomal protein S8E